VKKVKGKKIGTVWQRQAVADVKKFVSVKGKKWSQIERLAETLDCTFVAVYGWLSKRSFPSEENVGKIFFLLNAKMYNKWKKYQEAAGDTKSSKVVIRPPRKKRKIIGKKFVEITSTINPVLYYFGCIKKDLEKLRYYQEAIFNRLVAMGEKKLKVDIPIDKILQAETQLSLAFPEDKKEEVTNV
jgi:hypothetical protein